MMEAMSLVTPRISSFPAITPQVTAPHWVASRGLGSHGGLPPWECYGKDQRPHHTLSLPRMVPPMYT
jgi:hypothetical protein